MRRALVVAGALLAVSAPLTASAAEGGGRQKIAVLDIRAVQGVQPGTATILTAIVVDDTARSGYDVISQGDVAAMIGFEKQKKILGCGEDSSCLAEIGGALGVDYVLTGQVGQIGSRYHLSFQILDARKARVISRSARFSERNEDDLANAAQACVAELIAAAKAGAKVAAAPPKRPPAAAAPAPLPPPPPAQAAPPPPPPPPDLSARPAAAAPPVAPAPAPPAPAVRPSRTGAWLALGAGVALMAGGAAFGLKAKSERDDLAKAWASPDYAAIYDTKSKSAKDAALLSNVCWVAGGASTLLSGWLFWRSRTPRVAVAPAVGADGRLALVAGGSF